MGDRKAFAVRLPPDSAEAVEGYVEEHDVSKTDALRRAIDEYFVESGGEGGAPGVARQSAGGRVLPTVTTALLAAGLIGLVLGELVAGIPLALGIALTVGEWVGIDARVSDFFRTARAAIEDMADPRPWAVARYVWASLKGDHPAPRDPSTTVERLAWVDLYGVLLFGVVGVLVAPFAAVVLLLGPSVAIGALTVTGVLAWVLLYSVLSLLATAALVVGTLAQISLGTRPGAAVEGVPSKR